MAPEFLKTAESKSRFFHVSPFCLQHVEWTKMLSSVLECARWGCGGGCCQEAARAQSKTWNQSHSSTVGEDGKTLGRCVEWEAGPWCSSTAHTCIHEAPAAYPALAEPQAVRGSGGWGLLHPNQGFGCKDLLQRSHQEGRVGSRIEQGKAM